MLKSDNVKRYQWYVLWNRDEVVEFQPYFCVGKYAHEAIDSYHKTGQRKEWYFVNEMKLELYKEMQDQETVDKCVSDFMYWIDNAKIVVTERTTKSEVEYLTPINEDYRLKIKIDAEYAHHIVDYKIVSSFKKEEDKDDYYQQASLYQYWYFKGTGKKVACKMVEILKKKQTLPTRKDDLVALLPKDKQEEYKTKKVAEIRNALYLLTTKDDISNEVVFERDDNIIWFSEDLLRKAMKKADRLQSLSVDDIL